MDGLVVNPPPGYENWNRALRGAFRKGYEAAKDWQSIDACPYQDKRKSNGRLTWSRSFQTAWRDGWEWRKQEIITEYCRDRRRLGHGGTYAPLNRR